METDVTIDYTYDPLYRLTAADYSDSKFYHYSYDSVGNRLSEKTSLSTSTYSYDEANRLTNAGGVAYAWDANGNLLNDGTNTYAYDSANRLISVSGAQGIISSYAYRCNGKSIGQFGCESDRVSQTVNGVTTNYVLDQAAGLTQVLSDGTSGYLYGFDRIAQVLDDGTNTYLYGNGRISQSNASDTEYFLGDALGSVRQLTDAGGAVNYAANYDPFGEVISEVGNAQSSYGFTGESQENGMVYLRARYYSSSAGRFLTRDTWGGNHNQPMSYNMWSYGYANPTNFTDPSGMCVNCGYGDLVKFDARPNGTVKLMTETGGFTDMSIPDNALVRVESEINVGGADARSATRKVSYIDPNDGKLMTGYVRNIRLLDNCEHGEATCLPVPISKLNSNMTYPIYGFGPNASALYQCGKHQATCPYNRLRGLHDGLDFFVSEGTPVVWIGRNAAHVQATQSGMEFDAGLPKRIVLSYWGLDIVYGHLSRSWLDPTDPDTHTYLPSSSPDRLVRPGQEIGLSGYDHLHFGYSKVPVFFNPMYYLSFAQRNEILTRMAPYPAGYGYDWSSMFAFDATLVNASYWFWDGECSSKGITWSTNRPVGRP